MPNGSMTAALIAFTVHGKWGSRPSPGYLPRPHGKEMPDDGRRAPAPSTDPGVPRVVGGVARLRGLADRAGRRARGAHPGGARTHDRDRGGGPGARGAKGGDRGSGPAEL